MEVEYDPAKNARNINERKISFNQVADLDWNSILIRLDDRHDYGEQRWIALGLLAGRLHVLVFTETVTGIRVISFRKANARERKAYEQAQTTY
jgi:hypothetical protein